MVINTDEQVPQESVYDADGNLVTRTVIPANNGDEAGDPQYAVQEDDQSEERTTDERV